MKYYVKKNANIYIGKPIINIKGEGNVRSIKRYKKCGQKNTEWN